MSSRSASVRIGPAGHRDSFAAQVGPHLQAAIQRFRRAFALRLGFINAGQNLGDRGIPLHPLRRRRAPVRPVGARSDLHTVHRQCSSDRCDPVPAAVLVDELTDQRRRGSHSRAKKLVAALSIWIVASSSLVLRRNSRSSRAVSVVRIDLGPAHPLA
jgi:hypothetical protein